MYKFFFKREVTQDLTAYLNLIIYEVIVLGVQSHFEQNVKFCYYVHKISLEKCLYAFLLIFCDAIQDWKRSVMGEDYSELKSIEINLSENVRIIDYCLQIIDKRKNKEIDRVAKKLDSNGLLRIFIKQKKKEKMDNLSYEML